ncbi:ABC transporter permease subunit [Pontivivens insulae]|uniref:Putrescine transport system permease protein PotH n=1 Tax=Pontivivens insulae TaxID=1639689 RepID=A0A2R8ACW8_9RHOB|nr:ABC transporter permease subunit [Pontivivens insulae]RED14020.1 ABC-type spermidine/putrescine transport system permease subunit I [Pontivivens insulae]SPF30094.1 Putrescine transport system permease protein PotH [Pontivivens insulae]
MREGWGKRAVIGVPFIWLLIFFLVPFFIVFLVSLGAPQFSVPPYSPAFEWDGWVPRFVGSFDNYVFLTEDDLYWRAYLGSVQIAGGATLMCLLVAWPMAWVIARATPTWRNVLLLAVILPFWTSSLLRIYALMGLLRQGGLINTGLMWLGITDEPIQMMQTDFAVYLTIVFTYLPLMVLPLYSTLEKLDGTLLEAAADLGARGWQTFWTITLPLSLPGILAGCLLVFIPAVGEFVIPDLMGAQDSPMIGNVLWGEFTRNRDWPVAAAVAIAMLALLVVPFMLLRSSPALRGEA